MAYQDVLYPLCAALNYGVAASRIPALARRRRDVQSLAIVGSFAALGTTFLLATPTVWVGVDALFGVPNVAALIYQSLVIAYTACIQLLLLNWLDPSRVARRMRWRLALAVGTIAAMVVLFSLAELDEQRVRDFMVHYAHMPIMSVYVLVYLITFLVGRIDVGRLCLTYAPVAGRPWLRRGLYWTAAGAGFGILYFVARAADVIAPSFGADPLRWEKPAALAAVACTFLTMVGLTMPSWGPPLSRPAEWMRRYREFRTLHPFWTELAAEFPTVRLANVVPDQPKLLCRRRDLTLWLSRMKTELRDAQIKLGHAPHANELAAAARTQAAAAGYNDDDLEAIVQATLIEYGLQEKARAGDLRGPAPAGQLHGGEDTVSEVRFLIKLSRARKAPIVGEIIAGFRDGRPALAH